MSRSEIAAVACRLLAMVLFALAAMTAARTLAETLVSGMGMTAFRHLLESLPANLSMIGQSALGGGSLIVGGMWLLCGVVCWLRAENIALQMVGDDPEPVTSDRVTADEILAAGCRLIGMVILVGALRTAVSLAWLFVLSDPDSLAVFFESSNGVTAVQTLLETGLAVWLLLGTRGVVGLVVWARNAGTPSGDADADAEREDEAKNESK
jgi:hypothetical protein